MATAAPTISTTVRTALSTALLRASFRLGSRLAPAVTVRRAARVFCTPFASSRTRALNAPNSGAREAAIHVDGQSIATYQWGDPANQPYVLFAHGWSSHGTRIRPWLRPLQEAGYAVVAFDQAGHGKSSGTLATLPGFTEVLLEVGRHHGPAAAVIGHSLGGAAMALALSRGLEADRAILVAPAADPVDASVRFARLIGLGESLRRRMIAMFEARIGITFEQQQAHRVAPALGRPALVVHDLQDREVPWAEGERWARFWPQARLISTQGLGHTRILDEPAVISAGLAFLRGEAVGERIVSTTNLPYGLA